MTNPFLPKPINNTPQHNHLQGHIRALHPFTNHAFYMNGADTSSEASCSVALQKRITWNCLRNTENTRWVAYWKYSVGFTQRKLRPTSFLTCLRLSKLIQEININVDVDKDIFSSFSLVFLIQFYFQSLARNYIKVKKKIYVMSLLWLAITFLN